MLNLRRLLVRSHARRGANVLRRYHRLLEGRSVSRKVCSWLLLSMLGGVSALGETSREWNMRLVPFVLMKGVSNMRRRSYTGNQSVKQK